MALMKVEDALEKLIGDVGPRDTEWIPLSEAQGRFLSQDLAALRNQPPFRASAMDGYAVKAANIETTPAKLQVIGEAAAGYHFPDTLQNWEAVRIFTGAPVPEGADSILIQENTERDGAFVTALKSVKTGEFVRDIGIDFKDGEVHLTRGTKLSPIDLALAAAMNHPSVPVYRQPKVAFLATGDELVLPGEQPSPSQIIASNSFAVSGLAKEAGADVTDMGIARDDKELLAQAIQAALSHEPDILVLTGGASVGDHDYVQEVLKDEGMELDFWRIAMRPGKPLMAGHLGKTQVLGLPGNPSSAIVCTLLFLLPLIRKMLGDDAPQAVETAKLGASVSANSMRQNYLRGKLSQSVHGELIATPLPNQDSSLLTIFSQADCLIIRPPHAEAAEPGEDCCFIRL